MDDPKSLEAQLLGDMTYDDPRKSQAQGGSNLPQVDAASLLGDMTAEAAAPARPQFQYQELTDEQIAILQQQRAEKGQPPYTPDEIAELKAEFIERQRQQAMEASMAAQAQAQSQAAASLLAEPEDYSQPEKKPQHEALPQVDANALLEEAAPEPERRVTFNQEDLEAAKKAAARRASDSLKEIPSQTAEQQKRAREEMKLLRMQQQEDLAQKGFIVSIVMTVLGLIAGVCTIMFSSGGYGNPEEAPNLFHFFDKCYLFLGIAQALLAITIVLRVKQVKGFTSFINVITPILLLIPGITMLLSQKKSADGGAVSVVCYIIAMICSVVITFTMGSSEKLNAYYAKSDVMYD